MQTKYFEMHPDGKLVRVTQNREDVGSTLQLAASLANTVILPFRDNGWPYGVHVGLGKADYHIAVTLPRLVLDTFWMPAQDPGGELFLTPVWQDKVGAVKTRLDWTPPPGLKVILFVQIPATEAPTFRLGFLRANKLKAAPLPNIFPDGRVCTGEGIRSWNPAIRASSVPAIAEWATQVFENAPWNTDLLEHYKISVSRELVRMDTAIPPSPIPYTGDLAELLKHTPDLSGQCTDWIGGVL